MNDDDDDKAGTTNTHIYGISDAMYDVNTCLQINTLRPMMHTS